MMRRVVRPAVATAVVLVAAACSNRRVAPVTEGPRPAAAPVIADGSSLLRAMRDKYGTQWFRTLTFADNNVLYNARGNETRGQWRQRLSVPGKLRIDYLGQPRSGVLFENGMVHTFDNGRAIDSRPGLNATMLLTADIYALPVERSAQLLDSLGFAMGTFHRDTWDGQAMYVVGAEAGDSTSSQFWVDADRLVTVRIVQNERRGARQLISDVRLSKFQDVGGVPVATEVVQYRDGRLVFREQYTDLRVNETIPDATFDAAKWIAGVPR